MSSSGPSRILLLRHGATAESAQGLFSGRGDVELSETGREQARRWRPVIEALETSPAAFTSPLVRASETAQLAGLDAEVREDLIEWDLGVLEGRSADGVRQANPGWSLFTEGPPEGSGEQLEQIVQRCRRVLEELAGAGEAGGNAVLVAHGQFLRALTVTALGLDLSTGRNLSFGPARAAVLVRRSTGNLSLAGWNLPPSAGMFDHLT